MVAYPQHVCLTLTYDSLLADPGQSPQCTFDVSQCNISKGDDLLGDGCISSGLKPAQLTHCARHSVPPERAWPPQLEPTR